MIKTKKFLVPRSSLSTVHTRYLHFHVIGKKVQNSRDFHFFRKSALMTIFKSFFQMLYFATFLNSNGVI